MASKDDPLYLSRTNKPELQSRSGKDVKCPFRVWYRRTTMNVDSARFTKSARLASSMADPRMVCCSEVLVNYLPPEGPAAPKAHAQCSRPRTLNRRVRYMLAPNRTNSQNCFRRLMPVHALYVLVHNGWYSSSQDAWLRKGWKPGCSASWFG